MLQSGWYACQVDGTLTLKTAMCVQSPEEAGLFFPVSSALGSTQKMATNFQKVVENVWEVKAMRKVVDPTHLTRQDEGLTIPTPIPNIC